MKIRKSGHAVLPEAGIGSPSDTAANAGNDVDPGSAP